ncbi:MAG: hypothetical protein IJ515_00355 [Clostridia bacterium]|nr:hypothetical protein [Clostridia bacterium]
MSLNPNFREEYYGLLEKCILTVDKSQQYEEICEKYTALRNRINGILEAADALCTDSERLIDKSTGEVKPNAEAVTGADENLMEMLAELGELYVKRQSFAELGWDDDLMNHIDAVLAIGAYQDMEEKIISELGRDAGQRVICEVKKKILSLEGELGTQFFGNGVERLENLLRIKHLFSWRDEIEMTAADNTDERSIILVNEAGECFDFRTWAQMRHGGAVYVELELLDEMNVRTFNYYRVDAASDRQAFTLVEDGDLIKVLERKQERLAI